MKHIENLGKIMITAEGQWKPNLKYDRLCLVHDRYYATYLSTKPVPLGIPLCDKHYWQPICVLDKVLLADYDNFKDYVMEHIDEIIEDVVRNVLNSLTPEDRLYRLFKKWVKHYVEYVLSNLEKYEDLYNLVVSVLQNAVKDYFDNLEEDSNLAQLIKKYVEASIEDALQKCHEECKAYTDEKVAAIQKECEEKYEELKALIESYHNYKVNWQEIDNPSNVGPVDYYVDMETLEVGDVKYSLN